MRPAKRTIPRRQRTTQKEMNEKLFTLSFYLYFTYLSSDWLIGNLGTVILDTDVTSRCTQINAFKRDGRYQFQIRLG